MNRALSYRNTVELLFDDEDTISGLCRIVDENKNWGQFNVRIPSWVIVTLIDGYKSLAEQQLGTHVPVVVDDEDDDRGL